MWFLNPSSNFLSFLNDLLGVGVWQERGEERIIEGAGTEPVTIQVDHWIGDVFRQLRNSLLTLRLLVGLNYSHSIPKHPCTRPATPSYTNNSPETSKGSKSYSDKDVVAFWAYGRMGYPMRATSKADAARRVLDWTEKFCLIVSSSPPTVTSFWKKKTILSWGERDMRNLLYAWLNLYCACRLRNIYYKHITHSSIPIFLCPICPNLSYSVDGYHAQKMLRERTSWAEVCTLLASIRVSKDLFLSRSSVLYIDLCIHPCGRNHSWHIWYRSSDDTHLADRKEQRRPKKHSKSCIVAESVKERPSGCPECWIPLGKCEDGAA